MQSALIVQIRRAFSNIARSNRRELARLPGVPTFFSFNFDTAFGSKFRKTSLHSHLLESATRVLMKILIIKLLQPFSDCSKYYIKNYDT